MKVITAQQARNIHHYKNTKDNFDVLLTVYLSTILANDQINAQILFIICLLYSSTRFEHCCAHHQEVKIVLYSMWCHQTL